MTEKPGKLQPALIGGAIAGLLSVIPFVAIGCCVYAIIGGAVAAYLLIKRSPVFRVTTGDGAVTGLLAGLVGSVIMLPISVPLTLARWPLMIEQMSAQAQRQSDPNTQQTLEKVVAFAQNNRVVCALIFWLISAIIVTGFALLGGIIGVAIFEKRKNAPFPPQGPPPDYPPPNFPPPGSQGGSDAPNQPPY